MILLTQFKHPINYKSFLIVQKFNSNTRDKNILNPKGQFNEE